jgi:hypothetical protein
MPLYAVGKRAFGFCDRCAQRYPLQVLKKQIYNQRPIDLRVCPSCLDVDQPQLQLGKYPVLDPIALRNPRPDTSQNVSRALFGWTPIEGVNSFNTPGVTNIAGVVGNNAVDMIGYVGTAFVQIVGVTTVDVDSTSLDMTSDLGTALVYINGVPT